MFDFRFRKNKNKQIEKAALYLVDDKYSYALFNTEKKEVIKYFEGDFSGVSIRNKTSKYYFEHYRNVFTDLHTKGAPVSAPVSIALSANDALIRIIDIPHMTTQEARTTVIYNYDEYLPFPPDATVFDMAQIEFPGPLSIEKRFVLSSLLKQISVSISESAYGLGYDVSFIEPVQISIERVMNTSDYNQYDSKLYVFTMDNMLLMVYSWKGCGIFYREVLGTDDIVSMVKAIMSSVMLMKSRSSWGFDGISVIISQSQNDGLSNRLSDALKEQPEFDNVSVYNPLVERGYKSEVAFKDEIIPLLGLIMR